MRGVLHSRLRPDPDPRMDLATTEQSSSSAISELQKHLRDGSFVVTAEVSPPVSTDPAEFIARALALRGLATAINVTDGAGSRAHLSSLAAAHFLVRSGIRSEEHTSELQSRQYLVCRLLLEKKK